MAATEQGNEHISGADRAEPGVDNLATEFSLARMESEMARQGKSIRRTQAGFTLFAAAALVIALVNLIAVGFKLGTKDIHVSVTRAVAPAAPAKGTPAAQTPAALPSKVNVGLKEFAINPSSSQGAAGKVTFKVHNNGTVPHEFVVIKTTKSAANLLKGSRADESGNIGETGDLQVGQTKSLSLKLAPGHYALICNLPGHYKAGQHVDFTVK